MNLIREDGSIVSEDSYAIRGCRITWMGGRRPAHGMQVQILLRRRFFSGTALVFALMLGVLGGVFLQANMASVEHGMNQVIRMIPNDLAFFGDDFSRKSV